MTTYLNNPIFSRTRLPILTLLAAAILLLGSSCGDDGPTGGGDKTPPTVISTSPTDGATDVSINPTIEIAFSEKLVANSVSGAISISPTINLSLTIADSLVGITIVGGSLEYNTTYTITASTAVTDLAGNHLAQAFEFSFTTEVDPNTLPPTVLATTPINNATGISVSQPISASFSKGMDSATTAGAFSVDNGATGTVQVNGSDVIFTPDSDLAYSTTYTATISTAAQDTFGLSLAAPVSWSFTTEPDPATPVVSILTPQYDAIVGDTFMITADASSSAGIDSVVYFIGASRIGVATVAPYQLNYFLPGANIGDGFQLSATAYAENLGQTLVTTSSSVPLTFKWVFVAQDNVTPATFLNELWYRSSDSVVEFRIVYWDNWNSYPYPVDDSLFDTSFAYAVYIDSDLNPVTGRTHVGEGGALELNGMGADYRVLVGFKGGDTCFSAPIPNDTLWQLLSDTSGLPSHSVPPDTNEFVFGLRWADLDDASALDLFMFNADFRPFVGGGDIDFDFFPDLGAGLIQVTRDDRYVGPVGSNLSAPAPRILRDQRTIMLDSVYPNPFD